MKTLGATHVIDYTKEDFTNVDEKFDSVFDAVGKSTFGACKKILKDKGNYASSELGPFCQNPLLALYTPIFGNKQVHFPIPKNEIADAEYLCALMETRQFTPLIDRTYTFDDIVSAFNYVETGEKIGNVVISVL